MAIETIGQDLLKTTALGGRKWDESYRKWQIDSKRPENQMDTYLALCEPRGEFKQMERMGKMLVVHRDFLVSNPSLNLIQEALPHFTKEMGTGPMNNLLQGMVKYPLDLVSGIIEEESNPSLARVTQAALNLAMPLSGVLAKNLQNNDGIALALALSSCPQVGEFARLLLSLRNKHVDPTIRSALAGCWAILDESLQLFILAENSSEETVPYHRTAHFPNRDITKSELEKSWLVLDGQIGDGQKDSQKKGIVFKIQQQEPLTKRLLELYTGLIFQKRQRRDSLAGKSSLEIALIDLTPDASLLIATPQNKDAFNPFAQKEWVQNTIIAAVKETREHISQGELKQPEVSAEQFANIITFGTRNLDEGSRATLVQRRASARSQIRALSQIRGDAVNLKDEESGLYQLGFDTMEFYAHEGGFVCNLKVMGTNFELFFDQNYTLQSMNGIPREVISDNMREKLEMIAIEYVYAIRTTIDDGNTESASLGDDEPATEGHDEVEVEGERGRHYKRAHLRVLPRNQRTLIDRVTETEDDVLESTLQLQELSGFEGDSIDALLDGFSWTFDPPNRTLQQKMDVMENKHAVLERIRAVDLQTTQYFGISLSDLNRLFRDAQQDPSVLNQEAQQALHSKNYPDSVFDLVRHLTHRVPDRSDALGPAQVTFVREVHTDGGTSPREMRCPGASRNIRDTLVPHIEQT